MRVFFEEMVGEAGLRPNEVVFGTLMKVKITRVGCIICVIRAWNVCWGDGRIECSDAATRRTPCNATHKLTQT